MLVYMHVSFMCVPGVSMCSTSMLYDTNMFMFVYIHMCLFVQNKYVFVDVYVDVECVICTYMHASMLVYICMLVCLCLQCLS